MELTSPTRLDKGFGDANVDFLSMHAAFQVVRCRANVGSCRSDAYRFNGTDFALFPRLDT